jgi:tetratricopeptide (TPR) repeat protein
MGRATILSKASGGAFVRLKRSIVLAALCAVLAAPALSFGTAGSYLAARHASFESDYAQAADYYTRALALDAGNPALMEAVISSNINAGTVERAWPIARRMVDGGMGSQIANMAILVQLVSEERFGDLRAMLDDGGSVGALVDGLAHAWATFAEGDVSAALAGFDAAAARPGLESFARVHKALALAAVGDFEGADDILSGREAGPVQASPRSILAHAQILAELDRRDDAVALIDEVFGPNPDPVFASLRADLVSGAPVGYDVARTGAEGIGEVLHAVGAALTGEAAPGFALLYARLATFLNPKNSDAVLLSAALLEEMDQFDLATRVYDTIPPDHPAYIQAEIGRSQALRDAGRDDAAVEALSQLARRYPDTRIVHYRLGDLLRGLDRHAEATPAYDRAIALTPEPGQQDWPLFFSRGITLERTDRWPEAEADFRRALELEPGQPQVLNYLGYSLVEMRVKLEEALDMIERAVDARPDDGYITDSLGWVLYRLGRYDEAIVHMERAVELQPVDPIINDHLGDVLWAVGRKVEARFQWHRALSFDPEPEEARRIRRKLEVGLDVVLEEEGSDPLAVAKDG